MTLRSKKVSVKSMCSNASKSKCPRFRKTRWKVSCVADSTPIVPPPVKFWMNLIHLSVQGHRAARNRLCFRVFLLHLICCSIDRFDPRCLTFKFHGFVPQLTACCCWWTFCFSHMVQAVAHPLVSLICSLQDYYLIIVNIFVLKIFKTKQSRNTI